MGHQHTGQTSVGRWLPYLQRKMQDCGALLGFQSMVAMAAYQATSTASFISLQRAPRISCPVTWEREEAKPRSQQERQTDSIVTQEGE